MKEPRRLLHDDPGFSRLVDAVRSSGPSEVQMSKALSLANEVASVPGPTPGEASWLGRGSNQAGLAILGLSVLLGAFALSEARSPVEREPAAAFASPSPESAAASAAASTESGAAPSASAARPVELPTPSVPVDELLSASAPTFPSEAREASHRTGVTPPTADSTAKKKPHEGTTRPCSPGEGTTALVPAAGRADTPPCVAAAQATFAEELALTSEARAALKRGDIASCIAAVDRYQKRFHTGVFAQEIDVIGIEALAKSGAPERARASAKEFLLTNEASPYADRVRSVLANTEK